MQQRTLGHSGYQVGEVGLGGNRIGQVEGVADSEWLDFIRHARELGVSLFDTSPNYGRSEELLGQALGNDPDIVLATKCPPEKDKAPADQYSASYVGKRCEESLRLLRRDAIEVYQLHSPGADTLRQSSWREALAALRDEGKIKCIAVSTNNDEMLHWLVGERLVDVVQIEYSLLAPRLAEILPLAHEKGVGVLVQMPLRRGILSGKFNPGQEVSKDHRATLMGKRLPQLIEQTEAFRALDGREGMTLAEIALRYALTPPAVSCIIPGARNREQLAANVQVGDGMGLSDTLLREIEIIQHEVRNERP